ncbi:MAG: carbon-nitrogen hydrolase family protein [Candidatus Thorarchaeota archaeon]
MLKIACIQPKVYNTKKECYKEIELLLKNLLEEFHSCEIICLPERWVPINDSLAKNIQEEKGEDYNFIKNLAKEYTISIISGGIWEKRKNNNKSKITSYFFNENGEEIGRQDKIHLYSYEKEQFEPGNELIIFKYNHFNFAILICFDMAFFETPRLAIENGADFLISPTQIRKEGMENWDIYLRARALENRVPIIGCNTFGNFFKRTFIGNSKIISFIEGYISPSKLRIIQAPKNKSGIIFDKIDLNFPRKLRKLRLVETIEKSIIKVRKIF